VTPNTRTSEGAPDGVPRSESDAAQLSSIGSVLDDLTVRIVDVAKRYDGTSRADLASDLYDVERSLKTAARRLTKVQQHMNSG
jgi:hypothetical protein